MNATDVILFTILGTIAGMVAFAFILRWILQIPALLHNQRIIGHYLKLIAEESQQDITADTPDMQIHITPGCKPGQ